MIQASCIYLGHITPCPETFHPPTSARGLSPTAQRTYHALPNYKCHLTKEYPKHPACLTIPYFFYKPPFKYEASLIPLALSLVFRLTVAPPCLNKAPLRSFLLFCLSIALLFSTMPLGIDCFTHYSNQIYAPLKEQCPKLVNDDIYSDSREFPLSYLFPHVFFPKTLASLYSLACIFTESMNLLPVDFHHKRRCFSEHPKA